MRQLKILDFKYIEYRKRWPDTFEVGSLFGNVTLGDPDGVIAVDGKLRVFGVNVEVRGALYSTALNADPQEYALSIEAAVDVVIHADIDAQGSVRVSAGNDIFVYDAEISAEAADQTVQFIAGNDIVLGKRGHCPRSCNSTERAALSEGAIVRAAGGVELVAADLLEVGSAVLLMSAGDDSLINLQAQDLLLVGSLYAGASVDGAGNVEWSGGPADIEVTADTVILGGQGIDDSGNDVARGGAMNATGHIKVDFATRMALVNALSAIRTDASAAGTLTATEPSRIDLHGTGALTIKGRSRAWTLARRWCCRAWT